jgi:hypothetical protein
MTLTLKVNAKSITTFLLKIVCALLVANVLSVYLRVVSGYESAMGFIHMFDFDRELNIPAFYSSLAILLAAGILWFISRDQAKKSAREQAIYWKVLCFIFVFLSLDELLSVHEHFGRINTLLSGDLNKYAQATSNKIWFIPYGIIFLAVGVFFIRFFLNLPYSVKKSMILAGLVFVSGAVGMELLGGIVAKANGADSMLYALCYTAEEILEMLGIVLFIRVLIQYIAIYSLQDNFHIYVQVGPIAERTRHLNSLTPGQNTSVQMGVPGKGGTMEPDMLTHAQRDSQAIAQAKSR